MKRFVFTLERVLAVKRQQEHLAELWQWQARAALDVARAEAEERNRRVARHAESLRPEAPQEAQALSWVQRYHLSQQAAAAWEAAKAKERQARDRLDEANRRRARAAAEVEALLTLRKGEWQAYQREVERERQRLLDEQGLRAWSAARTGEGREGEAP